MVDKAQDTLEQAVLRLVDLMSELEKRVSRLERGEHPHEDKSQRS